MIWRRELALAKILPKLEYRLFAVEKEQDYLTAHFIHELSGEQLTLKGDGVVVEHGTVPVDDLFQSLRSHSSNNGVTDITKLLTGQPEPSEAKTKGFELHRIGDAVSSRNVAAAMYDALRLSSVM